MTLRPYQLQAVEALLERRGERPLLAMPTGSGKTHVIVAVAQRLSVPTLLLAHRRELIHQARDRLAQHGIEAGLILAGEPRLDRAVQVASVQTLSRRSPPPAEQVVVDEAHHATGPTYQRLLALYPDAWIWGATATPFRLDGRGLAPTFTCIVAPASVADLCRDGTLVEPTVYAPSQPNLAGVATTAGDYDQGQLADRMSGLTGNVVEHWLKLARDRKTICFAVNIEHSKALTQRFLDQGVQAAHLDGSSPTSERDAVLADLRAGRIAVLSNCNLFGEGWDLPALEAAILARPTKSLCLHLQQVGRIMRAAPGKQAAIVLDHAGNHHRHGLVTEPIEYSLDARVRKPSESCGFKLCRGCYALIAPHLERCPMCDFECERATAAPREIAGQLVKFASKTDKAAEYARFVAIASERRYRLGWAKRQYQALYGVWPRGMKEIEERYACEQHQQEYVQHVGFRCARCLRRLPVARDAFRSLDPRVHPPHARIAP